jgi:hypothetical protein
MLIPELEKILHQVENRKGKNIFTPRFGSSISIASGRGMEFKEVREYVLGDDTRHIDWNVSSRMGELYVKEYHQENDRIVNIFLDKSASMFSAGIGKYSRYYLGFQFCAFMALLSIASGDKVFLHLYSDSVNYISGLIKSKAMVYSTLKNFLDSKPSMSTNHIAPYEFLKNKSPRKSISYVISDFSNLCDMNYFKSLKILHSINGVRISDPIDSIDPSMFNMFSISHPESSGYGRANLHSIQAKDSMILHNFFGANLLELETDKNPAKPILGFLKK